MSYIGKQRNTVKKEKLFGGVRTVKLNGFWGLLLAFRRASRRRTRESRRSDDSLQKLGAARKLDRPRLSALQIEFAPLSWSHFHCTRFLTDLEDVAARSQRKSELAVANSTSGAGRHIGASFPKCFDALMLLWRRQCRWISVAWSPRCSDPPSHSGSIDRRRLTPGSKRTLVRRAWA